MEHPTSYLDMAAFFTQGLTNGFRIGYQYDSGHLKSAVKNMASATPYPKAAEHYIADEVSIRSFPNSHNKQRLNKGLSQNTIKQMHGD